MKRAILGVIVLAIVLMGDAHPGWCPFVDPTPGADIHVPRAGAPTFAPPVPPALTYPSFDRSRDLVTDTPRSENKTPPMRARPPVSKERAGPETSVARSPWSSSPLLTTSAALLLLLLGGFPLLWIRRAATDPRLPVDLAHRRWRGWTQRTPQ